MGMETQRRDSAEILCVGTELLLGNTVNTNSAELSRALAEIGVALYHHTVVGDNAGRLREALEIAFSRNNLVITTGGLGPTYDDLTKETIAAYFDVPLVRDEASEQSIRAFFERLGYPMTENNLKQAMVPQGAVVLENKNGTAPGVILQKGDKVIAMLPGPPREMAPMFREQVVPYLQKRSNRVFRSRCIYFFGIGESALEAELREEMQRMDNPTLAPYAKDGEVMLRVTAGAATAEEADALTAPVAEELARRYPQYVYGVDVDNLQTAAVQALAQRGLRVALAESCTGGYVAKRLTEVPGSSAVFECGFVTYANNMKERVLGVRHETLEQYGAVSRETAAEMAAGARRVSGADIGVSLTGLAGPGGGTPEKPVGLVYLGIDSAWHNEVRELRLARGYQNERELIRYLAGSHALYNMLKTAEKYK